MGGEDWTNFSGGTPIRRTALGIGRMRNGPSSAALVNGNPDALAKESNVAVEGSCRRSTEDPKGASFAEGRERFLADYDSPS